MHGDGTKRKENGKDVAMTSIVDDNLNPLFYEAIEVNMEALSF
jgi:hypothetical protein